ncbi:hypothetical protein BRDID11002_80280 [Bradyrhizobium diazoefficiens]
MSEGVYKNDICTIDTNKDPSLKVEYAKTTAHGAGYWLHYSPEQIAAVTDLCFALAQTFKIEDIITHWMISPGPQDRYQPAVSAGSVEGFGASVSSGRPSLGAGRRRAPRHRRSR